MKVKLKTINELKDLFRQGLIEWRSSDCSDASYLGVKTGYGTMMFTVWPNDFNSDYLVVDHDNPISKELYEKLKILFTEDQS